MASQGQEIVEEKPAEQNQEKFYGDFKVDEMNTEKELHEGLRQILENQRSFVLFDYDRKLNKDLRK